MPNVAQDAVIKPYIVQNSMGGSSYVVDDLILMQRYMGMGAEHGTHYEITSKIERNCRQSVKRLVLANCSIHIT